MNTKGASKGPILDFLDAIVRHPAETFTIKVKGDSMDDAGIREGDMLAVDCSIEPHSGSIVVAALDGDMLVKRLKIRDNKTFLISENKNYPPIEVTEMLSFRIIGVVTGLIRKM